MIVRIFKPAKTAMQSGTANTKDWVLQAEPSAARANDPLMGWTGSSDTEQQIQLTFDSKEAAIAFATKQGWAYSISEPKPRRPINKSYADNFRYGRVRAWTH